MTTAVGHKSNANNLKDHYGIVIDAGSSGSRIQIYKWPETEYLKATSSDLKILNSVPEIVQDEKWSKKISPGVSSFKDKPGKIWKNHLKQLIEHAKEIIPAENHKDTPIFVLATAGMRLLPEDKRNIILNNICSSLQNDNTFYLPDCTSHVQMIDGETEGIYGWLALNYLTGKFNSYGSKDQKHDSYGFMDMGGASTQLAFAPNSTESAKHSEDLSTIYLRNVDGATQEWKLFVTTWLGFGANQARKRYSEMLILLGDSDETDEVEIITDPCMPELLESSYEYSKHRTSLVGAGRFEQCLKTMYPLLRKHLSCQDEPCLFNGVHVPGIDFNKDQFVGVSEYWYTSNDIFKLNESFSFLSYSLKVKTFCETSWPQIQKDVKNGIYGDLPIEYLEDACFKGSWIVNVLHEGFGMPRGGVDVSEDEVKQQENQHHVFKSVGSIGGSEVAWTLGRMLLYASSLVPALPNSPAVGIIPSKISSSSVLTGGGGDQKSLFDSVTNKLKNIDDDDFENPFIIFFLILLVIGLLYCIYLRYPTGTKRSIEKIKIQFGIYTSKIRNYFNHTGLRNQSRNTPQMFNFNDDNEGLDLEAGTTINIGNDYTDSPRASTPKNLSRVDSSSSRSAVDLSNLRTRSSVNLSGTGRTVNMSTPNLSKVPSQTFSRIGSPSSNATFNNIMSLGGASSIPFSQFHSTVGNSFNTLRNAVDSRLEEWNLNANINNGLSTRTPNYDNEVE